MADERRGGLSEELPRNQEQSGNTSGGRQVGGGPSPSDTRAPGGSSGTGGYGNAQNQQFHQGQQEADEGNARVEPELSRGERFDEAQGGGRGSVSVGADDDTLRRDQAAHQDRGQSIADEEADQA